MLEDYWMQMYLLPLSMLPVNAWIVVNAILLAIIVCEAIQIKDFTNNLIDIKHSIFCRRKGHTTEVIAPQENGNKKLRLLNKGLNVKTETYSFIISELGFASQEEKKLETFFLDEQIEKPDYNECEFQVDGVEGYADLVWLDKKIMIFCVDNENSFNLANQTNYKCLLLSPDIDIKVLKKLFA